MKIKFVQNFINIIIGKKRLSINFVDIQKKYKIQIKKSKAKLFIAIKPTTPIIILDKIIGYIDGVNLLTVNPWFVGQQI